MRALRDKLAELPYPTKISWPGGSIRSGAGDPAFEVIARNARGKRAIRSLDQLVLIEAYMRGDLEIEGDFVKAISCQYRLSDRAVWLKAWRRLKPLLIGRERCNPAWIAKHYDSENLQLIAADRAWNTYTQGIYESEADTLEEGAERKLAFAYESLRLRPGDSLIDVGCGWGGFTRFCARRGVQVTGITLSNHQLAFARERIADEKLDAEVLYRDFFRFEPARKVAAVSMMGVMEDLSDYRRVVSRIQNWLLPGGRVYLDFATERSPFSTSAFITKYIWPGTFRKVYVPELIEAVWKSPFEIVAYYNDRRNYWLWPKKVLERWEERKSEVVQKAGEETWRMFRVLFAAAENIMSHPSFDASAARLVLELPGRRPIQI